MDLVHKTMSGALTLMKKKITQISLEKEHQRILRSLSPHKENVILTPSSSMTVKLDEYATLRLFLCLTLPNKYLIKN